jgi:ubiquinone/menaquinone biosynthesis C-methylase UbiE
MATVIKAARGAALVVVLSAVALSAQPSDPAALRKDEAAREAYQKVSDIFAAMRLRPGAVVADIGAGDGFLTVRLARAVGEAGRVMAVDLDAKALDRLRNRVRQERLSNVDVITGESDNPHLARGSLDAAVMVIAYHEMRDYQAMLRHVRQALKHDGRLIIIESLSESRRRLPREEQVSKHEIGLPFVEQELRDAGFRIVRTEDPFISRTEDVMWLLAAIPDPQAADVSAATPAAGPDRPGEISTRVREDDGRSSTDADLRMPFERFKELRQGGGVMVIDVRSEGEYRAGHVPGATWIPMERIRAEGPRLQALGRPIVTYCS